MKRKPCGCYVDGNGRLFAACAECNGNAERDRIEIERMRRERGSKSPEMIQSWVRRRAREAQKIELLTRSL